MSWLRSLESSWLHLVLLLGLGTGTHAFAVTATGTYVGNGATHTVAGLSFQPVVVMIRAEDLSRPM